MTYTQWYDAHANKHKLVVRKLLKKNYSKEEIVKYFDFENMLKHESDFCLLYKENKKCHDIESLNCYLCACPHFRFKDEGIQKVEKNIQYSFCEIESKDGSLGVYGDTIHQDCSQCKIPHRTSYINKNFDFDWKTIMKKCALPFK